MKKMDTLQGKVAFVQGGYGAVRYLRDLSCHGQKL